MSYQVLARKYRPQKFSEVIGQDHVTRTLKNAIEQGRIAHGYIFSGHRGIGKTTIARILAMALNCQSQDHPVPEPCGVCDSCREIRAGNAVDVIEIDAATNRGIDEIRELREAARYRPARDRFKIYILDEAHQITDAAFNALLKTLEEPPSHIVFMMATTQPEDIPQTIRSRCQHFSFHAVRFDDIVAATARHRQAGGNRSRRQCAGHAGRGGRRLHARRAQHHGPGHRLLRHDAERRCGARTGGHGFLGRAGRRDGRGGAQLQRGCAAHHRPPAGGRAERATLRPADAAIPAQRAGGQSGGQRFAGAADFADERARVARVAERFSEEDLSRFMQIMLRTHSDLGYKQEQRFHLELGLLKLVHAQRLLPLEELLSGEAAQARRERRSDRAARSRRLGASRLRRRDRAWRPRDQREPEPPSSRAPAASPFARPSPFEADRSRKSEPKAEAQDPRGQARSVVAHASSASPAAVRSSASSVGSTRSGVATAVAVEPEPVAEATERRDSRWSSARNAVLAALEDAGQQMLAHNLEEGEWSVRGMEVTVKVAMSQVLIDVALGPEPKRIIQAALSKAAEQAAEVQDGERERRSRPSQRRRVRRMAQARAAARWPIRWCSACRKSLAPRFAP